MVTRLHVAHILAHGLHDASALVAEHSRHRAGILAFDQVQIAVAQARGRGADQYFPPARAGNVHVLDGERLVRAMENGCFHGGSWCGLYLRAGLRERVVLCLHQDFRSRPWAASVIQAISAAMYCRKSSGDLLTAAV